MPERFSKRFKIAIFLFDNLHVSHFCFLATQKRTGEACGPSDTCAGGGRCLTNCCHPDLAKPENVAVCKPDGWMGRCKTGYANYGGGCTPGTKEVHRYHNLAKNSRQVAPEGYA